MPSPRRLALCAALALAVALASASGAVAQITVPTILPTTTTTTTTAPTTTTTEGEPGTTTTEAGATTTSTSPTTTASTTTTTTTTPSNLAITAAPVAELGSVSGTSFSAQIGPITVTSPGGLVPRSWTVTVATTDFVDDDGQVVPMANVAYASGIAQPGTTALLFQPGQLTSADAVALDEPAIAFEGSSALTETRVVWNPTLVVTVPAGAGEGTYSGTVTHSAF